MRLTPRSVAASAVLLIAVTGCAPQEEATSGSTSTDAQTCTKDGLELKTAGTLTVGTDKPAYPPWFVDDDPTNGEGYESAVTYAVADQLGFARDEVTWITVPFNSAYAPGEKAFDFDVNQVSISDERAQAVDFSSGYYTVRQSVVTTASSPIADASSIADLADAKLGAQVGTTSLTAISEVVGASQDAAVYDTNDQALQALQNGQVDGIVVDLPTAFYMTGAQLDDGVIVGQLPASDDGEAEQFGLVLDKGSTLTSCVSAAVDTLREDGTLDELAAQWLAGAGAPELK